MNYFVFKTKLFIYLRKSALASLEVAKVFDKVWHQGLKYKLFNYYNMTTISNSYPFNSLPWQVSHRDQPYHQYFLHYI